MTDVNTRADSIIAFLSGASSDGATQTDPDLSLGNFRSSTEVGEMSVSVTSPIVDLNVDSASSNNAEGAGTLTALDANTIAWTPPGGSQGPAVAILNGETKIVEGGGGNLAEYITVSRTSATALTGAATVTLAVGLNRRFDDKTSTEQSAGDTDFRGTVLKNKSAVQVDAVFVYIGSLGTDSVSDGGQLPASGAGTITTTGTFANWPETGGCAIYDGATLQEIVYYESRTATVLTVPTAGRALLGTSASAGDAADNCMAVPLVEIANEAPSSQPTGNFQTIADEGTAPTSVTFVKPHTAAAGISLGNIPGGEIVCIWEKRTTIVGALATTDLRNSLRYAYDAA